MCVDQGKEEKKNAIRKSKRRADSDDMIKQHEYNTYIRRSKKRGENKTRTDGLELGRILIQNNNRMVSILTNYRGVLLQKIFMLLEASEAERKNNSWDTFRAKYWVQSQDRGNCAS